MRLFSWVRWKAPRGLWTRKNTVSRILLVSLEHPFGATPRAPHRSMHLFSVLLWVTALGLTEAPLPGGHTPPLQVRPCLTSDERRAGETTKRPALPYGGATLGTTQAPEPPMASRWAQSSWDLTSLPGPDLHTLLLLQAPPRINHEIWTLASGSASREPIMLSKLWSFVTTCATAVISHSFCHSLADFCLPTGCESCAHLCYPQHRPQQSSFPKDF